MAPDRQRRQRDCALGDGASVRQIAPDAVGSLDRPFGDGAVFALDPRIACPRHVAQRGDERLVGAQHERKGQAAALRLIDEPRQAVARLGFARDLKPKPGQKRDLGFRRDDRALAADV